MGGLEEDKVPHLGDLGGGFKGDLRGGFRE